MKRQQDLQARLVSLETLGDAVGAMKSLSAHHFREARKALELTRRYRVGLDRVLTSTGAMLPAGGGARGLVVVGGEMGFCGAYNTRLATAAAQLRVELGPGPTFCVGQRAASYLRRRDVMVDRVHAGPTGVGGTTELLLRLAQDIIGDYLEGGLASFDVLASEFGGVGAFEPKVTRLLPVHIEPEDGAPRPRYVGRAHLADVAVRELLYITMAERLLDALASEHGARLLATQAAEQWLEGHTLTLRRRLSAARREASTQEVIEIATGARAHGKHP